MMRLRTIAVILALLLPALADETFAKGAHSLAWDERESSGREVSSGTYIVRVETEERVEVGKVMLVR